MIYGPALSAFEISSIAKGYWLVDRAVKKAPVKILEGCPLTPGKFYILLNGDEASIEESAKEITTSCHADQILDSCLIPQIHTDVLPAAYAQIQERVEDCVGIFETSTICSGLLASDSAAKAAHVKLLDLRLARGIGGKSFFILTGRLEEVEAAVEAGREKIQTRGTFLRSEILPRPHEDFLNHFFNLPVS